MTTMLDHITTFDYTLHTNLQGQGIGANWVFLLPRLDLKRILCIGAPSEDMLPTLQLLSQELICTKSVTGRKVTVQFPESIPTSSVDFIYVRDTDAITLAELKRILKPDGLLYYEYYGQDRTGFSIQEGTVSRFWLTPTVGNMETAVCVDQVHSTAFIRFRQLYTSTIRNQTLQRLGKHLVGKSPSLPVTQEEALTESSTSQNATRPLKRILRNVLRRTRNILAHSAPLLEQNLIFSPFTGRWTRRYGTLVQNGKKISGGPPRYLQFGAEQCGMDIRRWEWAFVAKCDYPSQKLLFYLFPESVQRPSVIIKMVRAPQYNERLEREYRGLNHLSNLEFVHRHTIPQIIFQGYHHGLFFIGESVLDGQPFAQKTSFDSQCKYARFVVQWLLDLGVVTRTDGDGAEVAALLMPLYERFIEVYNPNISQQRFLKQQFNRLSQAGNIPVVLLHGDLGLHNLLITPEDTVAFLDWENAEIKSLPLWNVFNFLSSYCTYAGKVSGRFSKLDAYQHFFLNKSPIQPLVLDAVDRYCETIGLDRDLIVPLYYLFWMYRALKQSTIVDPAQLQHALSWQVLQLSIHLHNSATLQAFM